MRETKKKKKAPRLYISLQGQAFARAAQGNAQWKLRLLPRFGLTNVSCRVLTRTCLSKQGQDRSDMHTSDTFAGAESHALTLCGIQKAHTTQCSELVAHPNTHSACFDLSFYRLKHPCQSSTNPTRGAERPSESVHRAGTRRRRADAVVNSVL